MPTGTKDERKLDTTPTEVELLKPHTHRNADYQPGAKITMRPDQAKRLCDREDPIAKTTGRKGGSS